jgi:chromate transport protein ChrA
MSDETESGAQITAATADSPAGVSNHRPVVEGGRPISMLVLGRIFLEIGATSFGGLGPFLTVVERELVDKRPVLKATDIAEAVAATRLLPGSSLIQVTSYLGYRIRGWRGAAVASVACILPSAIAMPALGRGTDRGVRG